MESVLSENAQMLELTKKYSMKSILSYNDKFLFFDQKNLYSRCNDTVIMTRF